MNLGERVTRSFDNQQRSSRRIDFMKITNVECHVLVVTDLMVDANSSAQDDIVVIVQTDEGISGIGEVDTNPWCVQALIKSPGTHNLARGLEEMIVGCDPLEVEALWD